MILESGRLIIRALKPDELDKYVRDINPFLDTSVNMSKNEISEQLRPVLVEKIIPDIRINRSNYLFYTLWLLIDKKFNASVGSIMFKGPPDNEGKAEIGYGTHEEFQNKGYMTEAVDAICTWAFNSGRVKTVIAETARNNYASFTVLKKNGFVKFKENDNFFYWMKPNNV